MVNVKSGLKSNENVPEKIFNRKVQKIKQRTKYLYVTGKAYNPAFYIMPSHFTK